MPTLHDLQSDFRRFLAGDAPGGLLSLIDDAGLEPEARLSIYRNNTLVTLTAALSATFPVVCRLVDHRFFAYAAHAFIQHTLPTSPCLVEYGGDFPAFLANFPPAAGLDYLPDVARLEWAINRVLHTYPEAPIPLTSLLDVQGDPALIRMRMDPATRFVASPYPVDHIWQAHQPGVEPMDVALGRPGVHLEIRRADGLHITPLPPALWTFRSLIGEGATLGAAAEAATALAPDFDLTQALAALFGERLIVQLVVDTDTSVFTSD
jgi:Putative DNA-binding domain